MRRRDFLLSAAAVAALPVTQAGAAFVGAERALLTGALLPQTRRWAAACTVTPTRNRQLLVNTLISTLINAGIWSTLDVFYLLAAHDSQAALINLVNPGTNTITTSGTLTFTADRGYVSNGSTGYLDTNYNPGSGTWKLSRDSNSFGIYCNTVVANPAGGFDMGTSLFAQGCFGSSNTAFFTRDASTTSNNVARTGAAGFYSAIRAGSSTQFSSYVDGAIAFANYSTNSNAVTSENFYVCRRNGSTTYCTSRYAALYAGSQLTAAQMLIFSNALKGGYLTAIGGA